MCGLFILCRSCKDLGAQNTLLYQHLDSVSSQAARIRQVADSATENTNGDADVGGDVDARSSELRSVVAYLRKEKEIVDLQLELSKQENVRFKSQLDHLSQSLQEVRKTLSEVSDDVASCPAPLDDTHLGTRASCPSGYIRRTARRAVGADQPTQHPAREQRDPPCRLRNVLETFARVGLQAQNPFC